MSSNKSAQGHSPGWRAQAMARAKKILQAVEAQSLAPPPPPLCADTKQNDGLVNNKNVEVVSVSDSEDSAVAEVLAAEVREIDRNVSNFIDNEKDDDGYVSDEVRSKRAARTEKRPERVAKKAKRFVSSRKDESDEESLGDESKNEASSDHESVADKQFVVADSDVDEGSAAYGEDSQEDEEEEAEETENSDEEEERIKIVRAQRVNARGGKKSWHSNAAFGVSAEDFVKHMGRLPLNKEESDLVAEQIKEKRRSGNGSSGAPAKRSSSRLVSNPVQMLHRFFEGDEEPLLKFLWYHFLGCDALANFGNWGSEKFATQMKRFGDMALAGGLELTEYVSPGGVKHQCFFCEAQKECGVRLRDTVADKIIATVGADCGAKFSVLLHAGYLYRCAEQYRVAWAVAEASDGTDWEIDDLLNMLKALERHKSDVLSVAKYTVVGDSVFKKK